MCSRTSPKMVIETSGDWLLVPSARGRDGNPTVGTYIRHRWLPIFQRPALAAVSGRRRHKLPMKSFDFSVLDRSVFRGSDRFTATVSIRQRQAMESLKPAQWHLGIDFAVQNQNCRTGDPDKSCAK